MHKVNEKDLGAVPSSSVNFDLKEVIKVLTDELARDTTEGSYYHAWQANLAMAFVDEFTTRIGAQDTCVGRQTLALIANGASQRFLNNLIRESRSSLAPTVNRKQVNGRFIKYLDIIYHTSVTNFSFWDRVKILFGRKMRIDSELFTMNIQSKIVTSTATTFIEPLFRNPFRKKFRGGVELKSSCQK